MPIATVTSKGQVTIPKSVRDLMQIDAGDQIDFVITEHGDVFVRSISLDVRALRGLLKSRRRRSVSVEEMEAAILRQHATKR
jgi:AbrB family looped-hinge helix DNA binding protein